MNTTVHSDSRPEAMADVPGGCELPLTRAVIQYRDVHEIELPGGGIQDIGLGLVLEGRYASSAQVVELGSGDVKHLDLSAELVVLDWVYEPTLAHVQRLIVESASEAAGPGYDRAQGPLGRYCFDLALRVIGRAGYGPLTRATIMRIGYRDICRDLDLHEGTAVRLILGEGRVARVHLDYDAAALVLGTSLTSRDPELEEALTEAFPGQDLRRALPDGPTGSMAYHVRFPLPVSLAEARGTLEAIRLGVGHLLARFEPERYQGIEHLMATFGARETIARLHIRDSRVRTIPIHGRRPLGPVVH